jgi:hypothetical protein
MISEIAIIPTDILANEQISAHAKIIYGVYFHLSDFGHCPVFKLFEDIKKAYFFDSSSREIQLYRQGYDMLIQQRLISVDTLPYGRACIEVSRGY